MDKIQYAIEWSSSIVNETLDKIIIKKTRREPKTTSREGTTSEHKKIKKMCTSQCFLFNAEEESIIILQRES